MKHVDAAVEEPTESFNVQVSKYFFHAFLSAVRVKHYGTSTSFAALNLDSLANIVVEALNHIEFNLENKYIDYFECHGSGALLGDPVGIEAIISALNRQNTERRSNQTASFGSTKASIGHLEVGAVFVGLVTSMLVLKH